MNIDLDLILNAFRDEGFHADGIPTPDGKVHRFKRDSKDKRKSAWYIGFQNFRPRDGSSFFVFQFGDWRDGSQFQATTLEGKALSRDESKIIKSDIEKASKQRAFEKEKLNAECSDGAPELWKSLKTDGRTGYMDRKKIKELFGARIGSGKIDGATFDDVVYIPVRDAENKLWGFQKIFSDGTKRLSFGVKIKGNFFLLGKPDGGSVYVCEGFATAATIFEATGRPTVCAFFASNLPDVCRTFNEGNEVILAGDDDRFNPPEKGGNAGRNAAEKSPCANSVFPEFVTLEGEPTDFNDLHVREGLDAVKKQVQNLERGEYVSALGYRGTRYYFRSSENLQIVSISRESFTKNTLKDLIAVSYWERNYPADKGGVDWDWAIDDLMIRGRKQGIFDDSRVRGVGVWKDESRFVVNLGDSLYFDGLRHTLDSLKDSKYIYEQSRRMTPPTKTPATAADGAKLKKVLESLQWKTKDAPALLAGWLVTAPVCGVLNWRPHLWVTGPKGSGKSYIMENIINPQIREWRNYFIGNSTEAGVRQTQKSDSRPIQFDEFESEDDRGAARIQSILELFRQASSESEGVVVKGTPNGSALQYRPRFSAIVSSIRVSLSQDADISRFCVLELNELRSDNASQFEVLKNALRDLDDDISLQIFSRTFRNLDTLQANIDVFYKALREEYTPRIAQQYSALLAGDFLLTHDSAVTDEESFSIVDNMNLDDARNNSDEGDEEDCLDFLLRKLVSFRMDTGASGEDSIGNLIFQAWQEPEAPRSPEILSRYGILVDATECAVYVSNKHVELKSLFRGSVWGSGNWAKSLARINGADPRAVKRIDRKPTRATKISLPDVFDTASDGDPTPF